MPEAIKAQIAKSAKAKGFKGARADKYVYGTLNKLGFMHGSKETAKGSAAESKFRSDHLHKSAKASMKKRLGHR